MDFHRNTAGIILTARVWTTKMSQTKVFDTQRIFWGAVGIVFIFTCGAMWADDDISFVSNPIAFGTQFQEAFVGMLMSAMVMILLAGLIYFGFFALVGLTGMGPVTCRNTDLEDFARRGNWAAAIELADRFRQDPLQRNFWKSRAKELGHEE